jgi:serine/threonine protein kinase
MTGWTAPGYQEVRDLGDGASGRVVLATHKLTGTPVAIKYLSDELRADGSFLRDFRAEARLLAAVDSPWLRHEYIGRARCGDHGTRRRRPLRSMPLDGGARARGGIVLLRDRCSPAAAPPGPGCTATTSRKSC